MRTPLLSRSGARDSASKPRHRAATTGRGQRKRSAAPLGGSRDAPRRPGIRRCGPHAGQDESQRGEARLSRRATVLVPPLSPVRLFLSAPHPSSPSHREKRHGHPTTPQSSDPHGARRQPWAPAALAPRLGLASQVVAREGCGFGCPKPRLKFLHDGPIDWCALVKAHSVPKTASRHCAGLAYFAPAFPGIVCRAKAIHAERRARSLTQSQRIAVNSGPLSNVSS